MDAYFKMGDRVTTDDQGKGLYGRVGLVTERLANGQLTIEFENSRSWGQYWPSSLRRV